MITKRSNNTSDSFYLHKDHQGSTTTITDAAGNSVQQFVYDPWGKQTAVFDTGLLANYTTPATTKGYTGHEHISHLDLIHMNGRIYDATIGRFMQADPFIQAPSDTQSYNRYSYVKNNPMSYTDPSGFFFKRLYKALMDIGGVTFIHRQIAKVEGLGSAIQIGLNYIPFFGQLASAHFAFDASFVATGSLSSAFKSGVISYAASQALQSIGGDQYWGQEGTIQNITANAMVGGVSSELQGGRFGHGFIAAGVVSAFKPMINDIGGAESANAAIAKGDASLLNIYKIHRVVASSIIGGTASYLSGGKFSNGAITGAFIQMFNGETRNSERLQWTIANPEHSKIIVQMQNIAQDAANQYDMNCLDFKCSLPWIRGTGIHKIFADQVAALGSPFYSEVSYKNGFRVVYGMKGSIRADGVYGNIDSPTMVFELKTGYWNYLSIGEANAYFKHLPRYNDPALVLLKVN